jgi:hypothetical protein
MQAGHEPRTWHWRHPRLYSRARRAFCAALRRELRRMPNSARSLLRVHESRRRNVRYHGLRHGVRFETAQCTSGMNCFQHPDVSHLCKPRWSTCCRVYPPFSLTKCGLDVPHGMKGKPGRPSTSVTNDSSLAQLCRMLLRSANDCQGLSRPCADVIATAGSDRTGVVTILCKLPEQPHLPTRAAALPQDLARAHRAAGSDQDARRSHRRLLPRGGGPLADRSPASRLHAGEHRAGIDAR